MGTHSFFKTINPCKKCDFSKTLMKLLKD